MNTVFKLLFSLGCVVMALTACAEKTTPDLTSGHGANIPRQQAHSDALAQADLNRRNGHVAEELMWLRAAKVVSDSPAIEQQQIEELQKRSAREAERKFNEGQDLQKRGLLMEAAKAYEDALRLDPESAPARQALRRLDRAAKLRAIAHGGGGGPPQP